MMRETLEKLFAGLTLSQLESKKLMDQLIEGAIKDVQIAAVLASLRMRLPTYEELKGFRESLIVVLAILMIHLEVGRYPTPWKYV